MFSVRLTTISIHCCKTEELVLQLQKGQLLYYITIANISNKKENDNDRTGMK